MSGTRRSKIWLFLVLILLTIFAIGTGIVLSQWRQDEASFRDSSRHELDLLAALVRNDLQAGHYQNVEQLLIHWGREAQGVTALRLITANGYRLAEFTRPAAAAAATLDLESEIEYSYQGKARLLMSKDLAVLEVHRQRLAMQMGGAFLVLAALLALLARLYQRQRLESSALRQRTDELDMANAALRAQAEKRAQAEVERDRLIAVLEATTDMVGLADPDGKLTYLNRAGREMLGLEEAMPLEATVHRVHPQWAALRILNEGIPAAIRTGAWSGETAVFAAGGKVLPVSQVIVSHKDAAGNLLFLSTILRDISELKQAEQALRASRGQLDVFKRIIDFSGQAIGMATLDARGAYANKVLCEYLGLEAEDEFRQYTFYDFYTAADRAKLDEEVLPAVQAQGQWTGELGLLSLDGTYRRMLQSVYLLRDDAGQPTAFANVLTDISELKRTEDALRESEARYRVQVDHAPEAIVVLDVDSGRFTDLNPSAEALFGFSRERLFDLDPATMSPPTQPDGRDSAEAAREYIRRALAGETPVFEWVHRDASGRDVPCEARLARLPATGRNLVRGSLTDIRARKQAEVSLRRAQFLLDHAPQEVWLARMDGGLAYVNQAAAASLGLAREELAGMSIADVDPVNGHRFREDAQRIKAAGAVPPFETAHRARDGRLVPKEVYAVHLALPGEEYICGFAIDVTVRKAAETALRIRDSGIAASMNAIAFAGLDGRLTYVNRSFLRNWGYVSEAQVLGRAAVEFWQEPEAATRVLGELAGNDTWEGELAARRQDGSSFAALVSATVIRAAGGEPLQLMASFLDISERKRAEDAESLAKARLSLAQRLAGAGLWEWDMTAHRLEWSDELFELFGLDPTRDKADFDTWRRILYPEDRAAAEDRVAAAARDRKLLEHEYRIVLPSGELRWIYARGNTECGADGQPLRMSGICLDIGERKRAEAVLRASEAQLEEAQAITHLGSWDLDLATGRANWSKEEYRLLGYEPGAVAASFDNFIAKVHPDDRERVRQAMQAGMASEDGAYGVEYRVALAGGAERIVLERGYFTFDAEHEPQRLIGTSLDVTALRRSERRLNEAQRIAHIGSWDLDVVQDCLIWSEEIFRIFEIDPAQFDPSYEAFLALVHPDDREGVDRAYANSLRDHVPYEIVHRLLLPDGRVKYVREMCETQYSPEGQPIRSLGTTQDVTALQLAENQLREYQEHLEELVAQRTRQIREQALIIDQIHDSVVTTDLEGVVRSWNKGAERLFGYRPAEAVGRPISFVYPEEEHGFLLDQVLLPLQARGVHEVEVRMRRKDGSDFHAHLSLSILHDPQGNPRGMIGYAMDITARKRAEAALERRSQELVALNRELEAFAYSVSHDLRGPLRGIDGFGQALLEDYGDQLDPTARDYLGRIRRGAQRMGALIDDILRLSRITRVRMEPRGVDLSALAAQILEQLREAEPERQTEIVIEPGLTAWGDPGLLRVALENLLGNAWKYTAGRDVSRIEFGQEQTDDEIVYFVRDNGAGFDMQYADKLFGAFQRLHHPSDFEGTGIGLATVQRIVHRHGGRVWGEGRPEEGAVFRFVLGRGAGDGAAVAEAQQ